MIVDAWIQHPTPRMVQSPIFSSLRRWTRSDLGEIPLAFTLQALASAGVDIGLCSAWCGKDGWWISNDELAAAVDASAGRLRGVGSVDLRHPMEAVAEVRRCKARGFVGIRVLPWLWELPPDDRRYYPVYVACVEEGLPFCLQVGHTGPLMPSEPGRPIPYLDRVALDFPELTIVAGHIGWPWTEEMIALALKYPNVWIDTSAYKPARYPPALLHWMRGGGWKKLLFGSNFPMLMPGDCLAGVETLGLDPDALRAFLGGNAARVFGLQRS